MDDNTRFVVGDAAAIQSSVALDGDKRLTVPILHFPGRLNVVMRIQQNRWESGLRITSSQHRGLTVSMARRKWLGDNPDVIKQSKSRQPRLNKFGGLLDLFGGKTIPRNTRDFRELGECLKRRGKGSIDLAAKFVERTGGLRHDGNLRSID